MCVSVCECGFAMVDSRNVISLCAPFNIHRVMEKQKMNDMKRRRNEAGESPILLLMLHEPEKTSIPVNFLESCFNVFSFLRRLHHSSPITLLCQPISALFSSIIYMLIFFAVTPHKLLNDLALNSRAEGAIPNVPSFQVDASARCSSLSDATKRRPRRRHKQSLYGPAI